VLAEVQRRRADLEPVARGAHASLVWTGAPAGAAGQAGVPLTGVLGQETARRALEVVRDSLTYLEPRAAQMRDAAFRAADDLIRSGRVESANKVLVEERLKGVGMHGERAHMNPMVALRTVADGDRWVEAWPQITTQQREQARAVSAERRAARAREAQAPAQAPAPAQAQAQAQAERPEVSTMQAGHPAAPARRASPPTRGHRPHKPAANHPWRGGSVGRPRCA